MKTRIIIPARLKSTRFPNKLIKVFNGKSIIEHVALRAKKLNYDSLLIATDSLKIKKIVENIGEKFQQYIIDAFATGGAIEEKLMQMLDNEQIDLVDENANLILKEQRSVPDRDLTTTDRIAKAELQIKDK